ncbi:serine hydrolase [Paraburkholderia bonniea]|uniref:serine hydrolase domain-containing protein n=1 Tax=Paraburkholderia bonniea TaxID=2152891 RepID=UPI0025732A59|nr:serine hydrolase [Paraburkholderia bonniea]WJF89815.1 serine hydrolase [Paraburkholderia bonniea]WJF93129.1 serine hydrolase [Paraburkholderia bonniea]
MSNCKTKLLILSFALLIATNVNAKNTENTCGVPDLATCPTPLDKNLPDVKNMLTWNKSERLIGFRNDYRAYPGDVFKHDKATALPHTEKPLTNASYSVNGKSYNLADYLKRENVKGFLVIKNGAIAYEYYGDGNTKDTLWTSRSVGKSIVSTLVGAAIKDGKIKSLDDKLTVYKPDLKGTAWENVTLKQLIQHTSGVNWNEDYKNPNSDFSRLTQCEASKDTYQCVAKLVYGVSRDAKVKPGEVWSYTTGGAWLLGDILERATGMPIAQYLQQKIWMPSGMANDGVWHSYQPGKHDIGGHGFNATLEDWGRFGLFVLRNGESANGAATLPDGWVQQASQWNKAKNSVSAAHPEGIYGYQWWNNSVPLNAKNVAPKGDANTNATLWAIGIFGQMIAVNQKENLVMVQWSTWDEAEPAFDAEPLEASLMFNSIANALRK